MHTHTRIHATCVLQQYPRYPSYTRQKIHIRTGYPGMYYIVCPGSPLTTTSTIIPFFARIRSTWYAYMTRIRQQAITCERGKKAPLLHHRVENLVLHHRAPVRELHPPGKERSVRVLRPPPRLFPFRRRTTTTATPTITTTTYQHRQQWRSSMPQVDVVFTRKLAWS